MFIAHTRITPFTRDPTVSHAQSHIVHMTDRVTASQTRFLSCKVKPRPLMTARLYSDHLHFSMALSLFEFLGHWGMMMILPHERVERLGGYL